MQYAGCSVACPFCGGRVTGYRREPIEEGGIDLRHNPPVCEKFWEDEGLLGELRDKLRVRLG